MQCLPKKNASVQTMPLADSNLADGAARSKPKSDDGQSWTEGSKERKAIKCGIGVCSQQSFFFASFAAFCSYLSAC